MNRRSTLSLERVIREFGAVAPAGALGPRADLASGPVGAMEVGTASPRRRPSLPNSAARQLERAVQLWQRERARRTV